MKAKHKSKVVVGLSGGVDSAVSALLLKEQGYDVTGIYMQNFEAENDDPYCTAAQDLTDARAVCDQLGIEFQLVNFAKQYWDRVFQHCLDEFAQGRTPNPDIGCNKEIKFNVFLKHTKELGADFLATGHYARCQSQDHTKQLLKGSDSSKDQSYFLYTLGQEQLRSVLFPLGDLQKTQVRAIAQKAGLHNHAKKDSTGICFIGERKFKAFLQQYLLAQPGSMQTPAGKTLGQHDGLMFYTLGQRKGLNIGGQSDGQEDAWYVVDKDIPHNTLIVAQGHNHPRLFANRLVCNNLHWVNNPPPRQICCW